MLGSRAAADGGGVTSRSPRQKKGRPMGRPKSREETPKEGMRTSEMIAFAMHNMTLQCENARVTKLKV